jgi:hypothetical protein
MTMRDPNYEMMRGGQLGGQLYTRAEPSVDEGIKAIRRRADELRSNLESVDRWKAELEKLEAVLRAWGDK